MAVEKRRAGPDTVAPPEWLEKDAKRYSLLDDYYHEENPDALFPLADGLMELYTLKSTPDLSRLVEEFSSLYHGAIFFRKPLQILTNALVMCQDSHPVTQSARQELTDFLVKELYHFKGERRENGSLGYIHQLQVATAVAGYMRYFGLNRLSREDKLVILYSALGHDTPEDAFPKGTGLQPRLDSYREEFTLPQELVDRIIRIDGALTRISDGGERIEYKETAQKISMIDDELDRSIAFMIKLGDRIVNMLTLGNLKKQYIGGSKTEDPLWHIKNVYKTYAMLSEVRDQLDSGRIDPGFVPLIGKMYEDLIALSRKEIQHIKGYYVKLSNKDQNINTLFESRVADRNIDFKLTPEETAIGEVNWIGKISWEEIDYPGSYYLQPGERQFSGYIDKIKSIVRARRNYNNFVTLGKEPQSREDIKRQIEGQKVRFVYDHLNEPVSLYGSENDNDYSIIDNIGAHFEAEILKHGDQVITPQDFFLHLFTEKWIRAYKIKSMVENEYQRYRGEKPYNGLGFEELLRMNGVYQLAPGEIPDKEAIMKIYVGNEKLRALNQTLFAVTQCEYLDDMLNELYIKPIR